jgi:hypothetical protein
MLSDIDLGEYYHALIANGFDTWDQTLHITEEQLGHLGFKLGHRRRLQRHIASFKGYPRSHFLLQRQPIYRLPFYSSWRVRAKSLSLCRLTLFVRREIACRDLFGVLDNHRIRGWCPGPFKLNISCLPKEISFPFCGTNVATLHARDDLFSVLLIVSPTKERCKVASKLHSYGFIPLGCYFKRKSDHQVGTTETMSCVEEVIKISGHHPAYIQLSS